MAKSRPRSSRPRPKALRPAPPPPAAALLIIDHERLQDSAWEQFQAVRRQLDEAMRELHQHEEIDVPAYEAWVHRTFPLQITALREIQNEVIEKTRRMHAAQARAAHSGRSVKRIWQEENSRTANSARSGHGGRHGTDADEEAGPRRHARIEDFLPRTPPERSTQAREIYRRLVQRLHPDRGGDWTSARQQLWHEVQQAWAAGDADWLARLEVEWETAHEWLGPRSALSRLRAAIEELHAARRDLEHKFAQYRKSPAWRFTTSEDEREDLQHRVEASLGRDYRAFRRQLRELNATIALWEEDWTRPRPRHAQPQPPPAPYHEAFRRKQRPTDTE